MSKAAYNAACLCRLRPPAKTVLKDLAWFADNRGENCWPSVRTLTERTGLSRRAVQKILRELEQLGAIQAVGNRLGGRHRTTHYRLVWEWFEVQCKAQKGERDHTKRANGSAGKGERGSPEQNDYENEQKQEPSSIKGKEPQATLTSSSERNRHSERKCGEGPFQSLFLVNGSTQGKGRLRANSPTLRSGTQPETVQARRIDSPPCNERTT